LAAFDSHARFDDQVFGNHWSSRSGVSSSPRATAPLPERRGQLRTLRAIKVDPATVQILKLPATVNPGVRSKADPVRRNGQAGHQNGFSDHFPITIRVTRGRLGRHGESGPSPARRSCSPGTHQTPVGHRWTNAIVFSSFYFRPPTLAPGVRHHSRKRTASRACSGVNWNHGDHQKRHHKRHHKHQA
jgi:hypothetical protein